MSRNTNTLNIHTELCPKTIIPETFQEFWQSNKQKLKQIHTRKLNRVCNIQDTQGRTYKIITRNNKQQVHLIPKVKKAMSNLELENQLQELKNLDKSLDFLDNRVRAVEASMQRILTLNNLPTTEEDEKIISESLYTNEQKENAEKINSQNQRKAERQKERILEKVNNEMQNLGLIPLNQKLKEFP